MQRDHKEKSEKNANFPIFLTFFKKSEKNRWTVLDRKKRASQLFSCFFMKANH
jgi:hypothetical protein